MSGYDNARRRARTWIVAAAVAPALLLPAATAQAGQSPDRPVPAVVNPWVVSVGDSYISGEAGRWAGNTNGSPSAIDALGPTAYYDNPTNTGELIPRCHRSKSAEIHIGNASSLNLACSGARTSTFFSDGYFKPGLDFYNSGGHQGQALMLENFARTHDVTMVAVSIGGNDFGFGDIVQTCLESFLEDSSDCKDDPAVNGRVSPANIALVTSHITQALRNINLAMTRAGRPESSYKILLQNYPAPLPYSSAIRYPQTYARQYTGGCGLWNADIDWALNTALPRISAAVFTAAAHSGLHNIVKMDISSAFNTRRLCQNTVGLLEEEGLKSWTDPGAVDKTEWIDQIRIVTVDSPYFQQESLHPNFWGQLALRNCVRQAYNNGTVRGGSCTMSGTGRNASGEPNMALGDTTIIAGLDINGRSTVYANSQADVSDGVRQVAVAADPVNGTLTAEVDRNGTVWAKQGGPNAPWIRQYDGATQVAVATDAVHGPLIAVRIGGSVYARQGLAGSNWTFQSSDVAQVSVGSDTSRGPLIAVLLTGGAVFAREGGLNTTWVHQADGIRQVAVAGDPVRGPLIAVLSTQGVASAKEGSLQAPLVHEYNGVTQTAVASDPVNGPLIAVLDANRTLWAKQGGLSEQWVRQYDNVTQTAVATDTVHGPLITTVDTGRRWRVKQGGLSAGWLDLLGNITQVSAGA